MTDPYFLYHEALRYEAELDVYNAVKLYKMAARYAPNWAEPPFRLGRLYALRAEWKPSYHYSRLATELDPRHEDGWQNLALAATALSDWRTARSAWNKLGYSFRLEDRALELDMGIVALQLPRREGAEIVWARSLDPARAVLESIPQPGSEFRYGDVLLHDREPCGYRAVRGGTIQVFEARDRLQRGHFKTFVAVLHTGNRADVATLDRMCLDQQIGFDNWTGTIRQLSIDSYDRLPEYFDSDFLQRADPESFVIGLAANEQYEIEQTLENWRIITGTTYELADRPIL